MKNWTVEKKDFIENKFLFLIGSIEMDIPNNYEDIVQYMYEYICENDDNNHNEDELSNRDVMYAFTNWIESNVTESNMDFEDAKKSNGDLTKYDVSNNRSTL